MRRRMMNNRDIKIYDENRREGVIKRGKHYV